MMRKNTGKKRGPPKAAEAEQAAQFRRPLQWLNRILDALIAILESQRKFNAPVSPGTIRLLNLLAEFKIRAIREGFQDWFAESRYRFLVWYGDLEGIDRALSGARKLAHDKDGCRARLGWAAQEKHALISRFPEFLGVPFAVWYPPLYAIDFIIARLDTELGAAPENISQDDLRRILRRLQGAIDGLIETAAQADDGGAGGQEDEIRVDLDYLRQDGRFLLDQVRSGDWDVDRFEDRARIRRILRRLRGRKRNIIRRLGSFGGNSAYDWYKRLFDIDFHIDNAADAWQHGQLLPEWDSDLAIRIIKRAERAKLRFVRLFPLYLGMPLVWWYDHLYRMDMQLDLARDLLQAGQIAGALEALKKVRRHKHAMEEILNDMSVS